MAAVLPTPFQPGFRLTDGSDLNNALANDVTSSEDNITATAGGGKTSARQLTAVLNRLTTVATAADSVLLPSALNAGQYVVIINDGVASAQVFGKGTDTIDGVATGTGVALANAKRGFFWCTSAGKWSSFAGLQSS